jgi:hypothetical protein
MFAAVFGVSTLIPAAALPDRASHEFLQTFEGEFRGTGSLTRGEQSATRLNCTLTGRRSGAGLLLAGTCRANIFASARISIDIRYDAASGRFRGSFRDGLGTVSTLDGRRSGNTLNFLATETAESVRPDPPARMQLTRNANGISIDLRNTVPGEGSTISLALQES